MSASDRPILAISATFTADPMAETLAFWMRELRLQYAIEFAPYNQLFQQLLDPGSLLRANRNGLSVALVRLEDWVRYGGPSGAALEENAHQLVNAIREAAPVMSVPLLVAICPSTPGFDGAALAAIEAGLAGLGNVHVVNPAEILRLYPVAEVHDPHADELGHVPYTGEFFAALATIVARKALVARRPPFKAIVLDCDDTLWRGICGEDGPEGVVVDPARRALQEFMLAQCNAGMLLALASKNNEEDVWETFAAHPEMPLQREHFVAWRINWEPKSANLASLAEELDIGLDSFILIDDNPKECAEAHAQCPKVLALALPAEEEKFESFLNHVWAFDHWSITEEDRRRSALYAQRAKQEQLARQATNLEEFLESLQLQVHIEPVKAGETPRVAQLTQRTNQFNVSAIRRSEGQLQALFKGESLAVEVSDRFGRYGLVGVILFDVRNSSLVVDTFLLSCRVLGRGVEHRMLAHLGRTALERGLDWVDVPYIKSARNQPALAFLESVAGRRAEKQDNGILFRIPAAEAAAVKVSAQAPVERARPAERGGEAEAPAVDYERIARQYASVEQVLSAVLPAPAAIVRATPRAMADTPRTPLEAEIAALWADLLRLPAVGVHENFFDLGGHSLLAVQMLARVRDVHRVDLGLQVVYDGAFTVAELAKAIELKQMEQAAAGSEYASLLAEIESLSDEEVRALLAEENRPPDAR